MADMTLEQVRDWHTKCATTYERSGESALADQHRNLTNAIDAHLSQPAQAVDGWKLVPIVPTMEMVIAGRKRVFADMTGPHMGPSAEGAYEAMLAASPQPGQSDE